MQLVEDETYYCIFDPKLGIVPPWSGTYYLQERTYASEPQLHNKEKEKGYIKLEWIDSRDYRHPTPTKFLYRTFDEAQSVYLNEAVKYLIIENTHLLETLSKIERAFK